MPETFGYEMLISFIYYIRFHDSSSGPMQTTRMVSTAKAWLVRPHLLAGRLSCPVVIFPF